ncbi:MAG: hypothetical protein WCW14_04380 [Candidatus Paceibacterota bacterium]
MNNRNPIRMSAVKQAVIASIGIAGIITLATIAPNAIQMLEKFGITKKLNRQSKYSYFKTLETLRKQGYVSYSRDNSCVELTTKGTQYFGRTGLSLRSQKHSWDGKWRVLIFDLPEKRKNDRDGLRRLLFKNGFVRLQDSVWVFPFECDEFVTLLKTEYRLGKYLLHIIAQEIEDDKYLKEHFSIS